MSLIDGKPGVKSVKPQVRLSLMAAIRFHDAFTGEIVKLPLRVEVTGGFARTPEQVDFRSLPVVAVRNESNWTYSFLAKQTPLPTGSFLVDASGVDGEYVLWEPFHLTLPVKPSPLPPLVRDQFLVEARIFPTRRSKIRQGETTVTGQIERISKRDSIAGLRVKLNRPSLALSMETQTDSEGAFLIRIPNPPVADGSAPPASESATIDVRGADGTLLNGPDGKTVTIFTGKSIFVHFEL